MNKSAVEHAIQAGLAFDCDIRERFKMDRKKYFYPDLVKGYQITQDDTPLCEHGFIDVDADGEKTRVRIRRIHLEEDTGKAIHDEAGDTLMDYNRSGVPLIEIVSEPDMTNAAQARAFLTALKARLEYLGISDVKMEEGSLRCDVNINCEDEETGAKTQVTEVKNLNSFRAVGRAIEAEEQRHRQMLSDGEVGRKETRRWDDTRGCTRVMRVKETASDYRYSVEGDLPWAELPEGTVDRIRRDLPEMPHQKQERFAREYGLNAYDAQTLTIDRSLADQFEELMKHTDDAQTAANWMLGDFSRQINERGIHYTEAPFSMETLAKLLALVASKTVHLNGAKKVLRIMFETGEEPAAIVEKEGLSQITDTDALTQVVEKVLAENAQSVADFHAGKDRALGFLVGQCMKASRGKGNPQTIRAILEEKLKQSPR